MELKLPKSTYPLLASLQNVKRDWNSTTEGPPITRILGLEKNALRKIRVSGTIGGPLLKTYRK